MTIDRRALRKSMGTRSQRRSGTKTKCLEGKYRAGMKTPESRHPPRKRSKVRPRVRLAHLIKEKLAKNASALLGPDA